MPRLATFLLGFCIAVGNAQRDAQAVDLPRSLDPQIKIELVAANPDIVTPTGIAVDRRGRVLVIESHTHFRPEGYQGPSADRIRLIEPSTGEGQTVRVSTFFEGTQATMNLAVYFDDSIFVATRNEIFRLRDDDRDGQSDARIEVVRMQTSGNYPHNGLSGFAFDAAGYIYFGQGENLGAEYTLIGSDGAKIAGGGEGGNIFRCRPDGTELRRVATGFWNPFHVCFDTFGRLFTVDNDPDSRPPCRLLHVVDGGDYGYRFRNGRKGVHSFTAWNGELPGTLPMVAGTGEAPSGVIACESDSLPPEYRGTLLVTSWGDHRIERFRLEPHGASFRSVAEPVIVGDENFRPVGIASAPDGSLYVSDWVDKSYELHGLGRVWRISSTAPATLRSASAIDLRESAESTDRETREAADRRLATGSDADRSRLTSLAKNSADVRVRYAALAALAAANRLTSNDISTAAADSAAPIRLLVARDLTADHDLLARLADGDKSPEIQAAALARLTTPADVMLLLQRFAGTDPFIRAAAIRGLRSASGVDEWLSWSKSIDRHQRLAALLLLREIDTPAARTAIGPLLTDVDPEICFAAVQWVGESRIEAERPALVKLLGASGTRNGFEACLAALALLDGKERKNREEIPGEEYVAVLAFDPQRDASTRAHALRMLRCDHPLLTIDRLAELLKSPEPALRVEALRSLRNNPDSRRTELLSTVAADGTRRRSERAEAILGLIGNDSASRAVLLSLAAGSDPVLRDEALRSLRGATLAASERATIAKVSRASSETAELVERATDPGLIPTSPLANVDDWLSALERISGTPSADAGERVFYHPRGPGCYRCHQINGRGGRVGPDLSRIGASQDRRRLIESIVDPSREIAPQFTTWTIATHDGRIRTGVLVDEDPFGNERYADPDGALFLVERTQTQSREPGRASIMPQDVRKTMTLGEFRDLIEFLTRLR